MRVPRRSFVVLLLLLLAFSVPFVFWYRAGSLEATRQATVLVDAARSDARTAADSAARRIAARLETIRTQESQRPYFHYQNLFHDPRGASQGLSVVPSPLASGPQDTLIAAHFQIDRRSTVSLPTLNPDLVELNSPNADAQRSIQRELAQSASEALKKGEPELQAVEATRQKRTREEKSRVIRLDPQAFAQNVQSNLVYSQLKSQNVARQAPLIPPATAPGVEIVTGDFFWTTLSVSGAPALVALRAVATPAGSFLQGFNVSRAALIDSLGPAASALRLTPVATPSAHVAPIGTTGWGVEVDDAPALRRATVRAAEIKRSFQQRFFAGAVSVLLAILVVTLLIARTEKLAQDRAQFAAAAAHELRTPLAGLRLYGDMLAQGLGDTSRTREYAQQVAQEAERLGRVVTNMLEFTRLERGSLEIKPERGDLTAAVRECVEQLRPSLEKAGCTITFSADADVKPVLFDRDALHHIVQNLLDNAERYSRNSPDRTIDVEVRQDEIAVSDRGSGIDSNVARRLFTPFERGKVTDRPAGLGLGLTLVRALMKAHGGDVQWSPREGGGTTFRALFYIA